MSYDVSNGEQFKRKGTFGSPVHYIYIYIIGVCVCVPMFHYDKLAHGFTDLLIKQVHYIQSDWPLFNHGF